MPHRAMRAGRGSACLLLSSQKDLPGTCVGCDSPLDRDFNAATNLMLYASEAAGHVDSLNACGGSVRLRLAGAVSREAGTHRSHRETGAVGIPAF